VKPLVPPDPNVRPVDQSTLASRRDDANPSPRGPDPVPHYSHPPHIGFAPDTTLPSPGAAGAIRRPKAFATSTGRRSLVVTILIVLIVLAVLVLAGLGVVALMLYLRR
jgi:hypothetical protein